MKALLKLMDVKTLVAGIIPVVLGSVYSFYRFEQFSHLHMAILMIGMILMQSCANMINDIFDHERGADDEAKADEKALAAGEVSTKQVRKIVLTFLLVDIAIVLYYAFTMHWGIFGIGIFGALIMYLYSAGKRPISYTFFGEITAGLTMGLCIMTTVIYIQSSVLDLETLLVTLPTSIYIGTILLTNNISDHYEDEKAGRRTLPIHIGIGPAEMLWILSCYSLVMITIVFAYFGYWPMESLVLVVLFFPYSSVFEFRKIEKNAKNKGNMMALIGKIGIRYHAALILGVIIWKLIR